MANFPSISPQSRTYIPGSTPEAINQVLTGDETSIRHTNASTGHTLRLGYRGLTTAQHYQILSHYTMHGRFTPFDLPAIVLLGSGLTFPAGYGWIYVSSPQTSYSPGLIETNVELELVPPYAI